MTHRRNCGLVAIVATALLANAGCSTGSGSTSPDDRQTRVVMSVLSVFYGDFIESHRGSPPKDLREFRAFLESHTEDLKLHHVEDLDQLLTSPRDGQPFVIVCGKRVAPKDSPGTPWAAYEQTGIDGIRMAVQVRGGVHDLSDDEIAKAFSKNRK